VTAKSTTQHNNYYYNYYYNYNHNNYLLAFFGSPGPMETLSVLPEGLS